MEIAGSGSVGRPHVARALVEEGYVGGTDEAFTRYLGNGCPAYVPKNFLTPQESFDLVHSVGGLAFFAHPGIENRDGLIDQFVSQGLDGLEVWHSKHSNSQVKNYLEYRPAEEPTGQRRLRLPQRQSDEQRRRLGKGPLQRGGGDETISGE